MEVHILVFMYCILHNCGGWITVQLEPMLERFKALSFTQLGLISLVILSSIHSKEPQPRFLLF